MTLTISGWFNCMTLTASGWLLAKQGEMEKRLELSQRSLSATQQVYGEEHIESWWAQKWLALAHFRVNEVDVALALVRPAAQAVENLLGFEDMKTPNALNALGMIEFAADNILEVPTLWLPLCASHVCQHVQWE